MRNMAKIYHSVKHQAASEYAAAGRPIFPCLPNSKVPATQNGWHDATTDLAQIDRWWSEADYNPAHPPHLCGQAVVDLDGPEAEHAWSTIELIYGIPETYSVRTPRGGRHLYFAGELPMTAWSPRNKRCLGPHIDTRGVGSYVLLPPSQTEDGIYTIENAIALAAVPPDLQEMLKRREKPAKASGAGLDEPANLSRARQRLKDLVVRGDVAITGQGGDNRTFQIAAEILNLGLTVDTATDLLFEIWNPHCRPPWDYDDLAVKVSNADRYAQNEAGAFAVSSAAEVFGQIVARLKTAPASGNDLVSRLASTITPQKIEWLWKDRFPLSMCSLLAGHGGLGKTTALLDMSARVSRGSAWPCGEGNAPLGSVIYFSAEDTAEHTLVPRLMAAEADLTKIHFVTAVPSEDGEGTRTFHLQEDLQRLDRMVASLGDVRMIIFDPISSYFGRTDTYRNSEVRGVLEPVGQMAARHGLTIIGNTHLAKGSKGSANMRVLDSVAMTNQSRSVYLVVEDADEPKRRLFVRSKGNLGPPVNGLSFTIASRFVDAGRSITGSYVVWGGSVTTSADEAVRAIDENIRKPLAVDEAAQFLRDYLADGPKASAAVFHAAQANGHAEKTVRRAVKRIGIRSTRPPDMSAGWIMSLPAAEIDW